MNIATAKRRISKLSRNQVSGVWMPNLFIWVSDESTDQARAQWEAENRLLTADDRVCNIGWMV